MYWLQQGHILGVDIALYPSKNVAEEQDPVPGVCTCQSSIFNLGMKQE